MHIRNLLERDLYRYNHKWEDNDEPTLLIPAGRGWRSSSSNVIAYNIQLWAEAKGVNMPRRWHSTFTTTDTEDSLFFGSTGFAKGTRKVEIPLDTTVGWVRDDLNVHHGLTCLYTLRELVQDLEDDELLGEYNAFVRDGGDEYQFAISDAGYQAYKVFIAKIDWALESVDPERRRLALALGGMEESVAASLVNGIQKMVDQKIMGCCPLSEVPHPGGFEVWFEGPFKAHVIQAQ